MVHTSRRIVAGVCLVAAPLALVASELLYVSTPEDASRGLAVIQSHESSWLAANLLGLLAAALFVAVVTTLAALPKSRGRAFARAGRVFGTLGVVGYAAHTGLFVMIGQMARQSGDRAEMARLLEAMEGDAAVGVVVLLFLAGLYLGLVLLMIGATRAGVVPLWATACVIGAVVLAMTPVPGAEYLAEGLVVIGLAGVAWVVAVGSRARQSNSSSQGSASPSVA